MACGAPVICSDAGSLVEVVGNSALTFPAQEEAALVDRLHQIMTDTPLRQALRRLGLARAQQFSWQRTAEATLDLYHRLNTHQL